MDGQTLRALQETTNVGQDDYVYIVSKEGSNYFDRKINAETFLEEAGLRGPTGPTGPQGNGIKIEGTYSDPSLLPTPGKIGDAYIINGQLWVWDSNTNKWVNTGSLQGSTGPIGPTGPQGITGSIGPTGSTGPSSTLTTTAPLSGGGSLSSNRTLSISAATSATATAAGLAGTVVYAADNAASTVRNQAVTPASLSLRAPLASPDFTGTPTAPTATKGTDSVQIATTAFVNDRITASTTDITAGTTSLDNNYLYLVYE